MGERASDRKEVSFKLSDEVLVDKVNKLGKASKTFAWVKDNDKNILALINGEDEMIQLATFVGKEEAKIFFDNLVAMCI